MDALEDTHIESRHAASRLPTYIKFPSLVLVSLSLSAAIHTAFSTVIGHELGSVSRELTEEWQIAAMAAWKLSELAAAWYLRYDCKLARIAYDESRNIANSYEQMLTWPG